MDKKYENIPIGKPLPNTQIYIIDKEKKLQPIGIPGELCIAGESLARGYLNNTELTAEKFIENPFAKGQRMYKTGDLARWLPDGNIEFLGRMDNQVKVRGYRIELGEIENQLLSHSDIKEAIVIAREDKNNNKYLCGYILSERKEIISELREYLAKELPEYMIPAYFIQLDKMPFTANGKIDRKALLEPELSLTTGTEYVAPESEIEEKLVNIWSEVLGIERIGINDNFFELGGHSLKAINIVAKISKELNVSVPLRELFKTPTIKGLANYVEGTKQSIYSSIEPAEEKEDYYPLSSAQKRMYTLQQFDEASTGYNIPAIITIEGSLEKEKLEEIFKKLIKRHEALRTSFEVIDGEPVQVVHKEVSFEIEYTESDKEKVSEIASVFVKAFDLRKAPLLRVALSKINDKEHILMIDMHHIISDGVSMGILTKEFIELYDGKELPKLRIQYKDFAAWQNEMYKSGEIKKQEEYWLKAFEGEVPVLNMPTDHQRPSIQSFEGKSIDIELNYELTGKLKQIAKETGSTMYMVLLSAYNVLLSKYSGQEDIIIGSPIAGRPHADLENIMGMFVNTLAMRNYPESNKTFKEFLSEVKASSLQAFENQDYQFEELIDKLSIKRDLSRNPLFDIMFSMESIDKKEISIEGLEFKPYGLENKIAKFDLTVSAVEANNNIALNFEYCTKLFGKNTIERMVEHYIKIIEAITTNLEISIKDIGILTEKETQLLLHDFNNTNEEYQTNKTIQQRFEEQVEEHPEHVAVVKDDIYLTYSELNEKSNQLARILRSKGVQAESIVALSTERSIETIIGMLAVLKAGGAYLPIDPSYPEDRKEYMLEDSKAKILLTQSYMTKDISYDGELIYLDNKELYEGDASNLQHNTKSNNMAYIIYTSGSTGKPKGVMIEHHGVINLCYWLNERYNLKNNKNILQITNTSFDVSVEEIFGALLNGATLCIAADEILMDKNKFKQFVDKHNINMAQFVPATLSELIINNEKMESLKIVICGGDKISEALKEQVLDMGYNLYNCYGPTEITVDAATKQCERGKVTIGKPIANTRAYILDNNNGLQPIGVPGELCISGVGLARGYLNREELTAEKFVYNPYEKNQKMYKTGDLVRWLEDGDIEFLGRIDHQVKVRGFRIELGEIESQLLKYEGIREVIVIAKEDKSGSNYLCGYICGDREYSISELREHLSKDLPEYMIPAYFIQLDKLPLTPNGKVDRKALPEPDGSITTGAEYVAPESEIEEILAVIWSEVLGIEKIGVNDNFFELGGHSLKAMNVTSKIKKEIGIDIPLKELFTIPTIKQLSKYIRNNEIGEQKTTPDDIVLIKKGSKKAKNIFIVHDGSGDIGGYIELCNNINNDCNYWGIRAKKPTGYYPTNITIGEMANRYIEKIYNIQPEGSYNIMGWSLGGVIVFEMARLMEEVGKKLDSLILIDATAPKTNIVNRIIKNTNKFSLETEKKLAKLFAVDDQIEDKIKSAITMEELWQRIIEYYEQNNLAIENIKQSEIRSLAIFIPEYESIEIRDLVYNLNFIRTLNSASDGYTPKNKINTQMYMFEANENNMNDKKTWDKFLEHKMISEKNARQSFYYDAGTKCIKVSR